MCGIAVFISYKKNSMDIDLVKHTFIEMENRGTDSSGYYFEKPHQNGLIKRIVKSAIKSSDLLEETKNLKKATFDGTEKLIILHTRAKTEGDEFIRKNKEYVNNHPLFNNDYLVVHNGMIRNDKVLKYPYKGKVDSEHILAHIDKYGLVKGIQKLYGTMAIIIKPFSKNKVYFIRNSNNFQFVYNSKKKLLMGCSDGKYLKKGSDDTRLEDLLKTTSLGESELPRDSLYSIDLLKPEIILIKKIDIPYSMPYSSTIAQTHLYKDGWRFDSSKRTWTKSYK